MKSSEVMRAVAKHVASIDTHSAYLCLNISEQSEDITQKIKLRDAVSNAIEHHSTLQAYMTHSLGIESAYDSHANKVGKQRFINFMRSKLAERIADKFEAQGD